MTPVLLRRFGRAREQVGESGIRSVDYGRLRPDGTWRLGRRRPQGRQPGDRRQDGPPGALSATKSRRRDVRRRRRARQHGCWDHLIVAPLWVAYHANLGTLLRTCDAVGACIAVPSSPHYREALARGDTLRGARRPCIHWLACGKDRWIADQRAAGWRILAVELADGATPLYLVEPARGKTVVLLGHEQEGIPDDLVEAADECVEIPMVGRGASLNVAVAGSLVLYRLAGLV